MAKGKFGLGDLIEWFAKILGIKRYVDKKAGGTCQPCQKRKERLNSVSINYKTYN